ncbi:hypothetical protein [Desulfopila sp. IMCC35008]|uniref:hypothetical protein n=1 Tax=Desulfopila sp. IMCC35008 TaxID=2653858 RepID=UPI0013D5BD7D|nr:hypothetical protein [Desulfopila sp. IMCC35008]
MLESRQQVQFGYFLDFYSPNSIRTLLKRAKNELAYLVLPEDTTHPGGDCQQKLEGLMPSTIRSIAKVLFWAGVAIAVPLLLS